MGGGPVTGIVDDIRNLVADVRWAAQHAGTPDTWTAGPVRPQVGPLAGYQVDVWATTVDRYGHSWYLQLWLSHPGGEPHASAEVVAVAPADAALKAWRGPGAAGEAKAAAGRMLRGDADGLAWRSMRETRTARGHDWLRGWRPMADLAGYQQSRA